MTTTQKSTRSKRDWSQELSPVAKAEMLAATFHLLSDHMPKVWAHVPPWLQSQIKQAMFDCGIEFKLFSKRDLRLCVEYGQWLNQEYPEPSPTVPKRAGTKARKKTKKKRRMFAAKK